MHTKSKIFYELRSKKPKQNSKIENALILAEENDKDADVAIHKLLYSQDNLLNENINLKKEIKSQNEEIKRLKLQILNSQIK